LCKRGQNRGKTGGGNSKNKKPYILTTTSRTSRTKLASTFVVEFGIAACSGDVFGGACSGGACIFGFFRITLSAMLKIENLASGYVEGKDVISGINFCAWEGQLVCIVGPNGCGKSTLLKSLIRLLPYRGSVQFNGQDITGFNRRALAEKIALMAQSEHVHFPYTVRETVELGRYTYLKGFLKSLGGKDRQIVSTVMETLGLSEIADTSIHELSGGQLQRVFLARTLAQDPALILLDEPTNHLDLKFQIELLEFLSNWVKTTNKTAIAVLHDLNLVQSYANFAIVMKDGKTIGQGEPAEVFNSTLLYEAYGIDVRGFMLNSLSKWQR